MSKALEAAAREIARTNIPAYADKDAWAEALPMYWRHAERSDISGYDNPIATARACVTAYLRAVGEDLVAIIKGARAALARAKGGE